MTKEYNSSFNKNTKGNIINVKCITVDLKNKQTPHLLRLLHQNIQGFMGKELQIELFLEKHCCDVVCITEHWLKKHEMIINYRNHIVASSFSRESAIRGGSLILIRNNIKVKERKDIVRLSVERVIELSCVELEKYVIVCVYRPPNYKNFPNFISVMEDVLKILLKNSKEKIVCGDFNVDILEHCKETTMLLGLFKSFNLFNVFLEPTRISSTTATCIDNIFCNVGCLDHRTIDCLRSDHKGQIITIPFYQPVQTVSIKTRHVNNTRIEKYIQVLNNKLPIRNYNFYANDFYKEFFTVVQSEFNNIFKCKYININEKMKFSDWATPGIRVSRDHLYDLYDIRSYTQDDRFKEYVKAYSRLYRKVCQNAKSNYISNKIKSADNKIKTVWKIINSETGKCKGRETEFTLRTSQGPVVGSDAEVAQEFENFFTNIPIKTTGSLNSSASLSVSLLEAHIPLCCDEFQFRKVSPQEVIKAFKLIKAKNTEDLWGMSVKLCGSFVESLAPYLAIVFNMCVDQGTFPDLLKESKIVPLFKSGDKTDPSNFRPVSVLPVLSKIFEKLMLNQMLPHFALNKLLLTQQYGFTRGRSTTDAGVALLHHIFGAWENSHDAIGIFCDLSKAFDCVCHDTLLLKLSHYGIRGQGLKMLVLPQ